MSNAPTDVIDGLQLFVHGKELKTLMNKRVSYHQERAKFSEGEMAHAEEEIKRLTPLQSEFERAAEAQNKGMSYGNDRYRKSSLDNARDALLSAENAYKHHKSKAVYFTFFMEHLDLERKYKLNEHDLQKLEVLMP